MADKLGRLKREIIQASFLSGEGHIASAFSILDILWVLYDKVIKIDPTDSQADNRDRFFLSKGHASLGLYVVLAEKGFFKKEELKNFGKFNSILGGHPDRNKVPGVEASTGSLGHGFPIAVGTAMGLRILKKTPKVFVLVGDGESNEGTVWESALLASHYNLNNLCCIVDFNHSTDRALSLGDLRAKFEAFGWQSVVVDGHDHKQIEGALSTIHDDKPLAVIAETIKGKGVGSMENNPSWHHKSPNKEELELILKEIE